MMYLFCLMQYGIFMGAMGSKSFASFTTIEYFYSWLPLNGFLQGFMKIMYRGKWRVVTPEGVYDSDPWGT